MKRETAREESFGQIVSISYLLVEYCQILFNEFAEGTWWEKHKGKNQSPMSIGAPYFNLPTTSVEKFFGIYPDFNSSGLFNDWYWPFYHTVVTFSLCGNDSPVAYILHGFHGLTICRFYRSLWNEKKSILDSSSLFNHWFISQNPQLDKFLQWRTE